MLQKWINNESWNNLKTTVHSNYFFTCKNVNFANFVVWAVCPKLGHTTLRRRSRGIRQLPKFSFITILWLLFFACFLGHCAVPTKLSFSLKKIKANILSRQSWIPTPPLSLIKVSNGKRIFFTTNYTGLNGEKKYSIQILF